MPTLNETPSTVRLWGGWTIDLPLAYYERNEDGSWAAWGEDWAVDVTIIEIGGDAHGNPVSAEELLGPDRPISVAGQGWVGSHQVIEERDQGLEVFRFTSWLAATNTMCSCWVSVRHRERLSFAESLVLRVTHASPSAA